MQDLFDPTFWREILVTALSELGATIAVFLPNLLGALLILLLGWILSRGVELVAARGLAAIGLDGFARRLRVTELLEGAEIQRSLSQIVAKLLFWLVMLTFVLSSVETLGLSAVTETIDRLIAFIPNVIGAVLIGVIGLMIARFVATAVRSAANASGFANSSRLGFLAQVVVGGLVLAVAAEQLGVATEILVLPFTVALATAGFGIGLAFALGSRPVITHIMAGHFLKQSLPRDVAIEVEGHRGLVERIGAVETVLRGAEGSWSIPNARLLELIVVR